MHTPLMLSEHRVKQIPIAIMLPAEGRAINSISRCFLIVYVYNTGSFELFCEEVGSMCKDPS